MLFSLLKHYLDTDTALTVSRSVYYFTTLSHGVENYFPRLWGTGISDAIFLALQKSSEAILSYLNRINNILTFAEVGVFETATLIVVKGLCEPYKDCVLHLFTKWVSCVIFQAQPIIDLCLFLCLQLRRAQDCILAEVM